MIPWFQYSQFYIGPLPLQVWGLFVAMGMCLSLYLISKRSREFDFKPDLMVDAAIWMLVVGFIGARVSHILFYEPSFFWQNPSEILKVWHGGLSSFGGLVGAVLAFFYKFRHGSAKNILAMSDIFSYCLVFGWIVGRIGCFMIHDHLGVYSNCPLAIRTPDGSRLDMALLEIISLFPLVLLFWLIRKKKMSNGFYTGILFLYYGILRFILDFYRAYDIQFADARYFGLTPAQYFAIILAGVGGLILVRNKSGRVA